MYYKMASQSNDEKLIAIDPDWLSKKEKALSYYRGYQSSNGLEWGGRYDAKDSSYFLAFAKGYLGQKTDEYNTGIDSFLYQKYYKHGRDVNKTLPKPKKESASKPVPAPAPPAPKAAPKPPKIEESAALVPTVAPAPRSAPKRKEPAEAKEAPPARKPAPAPAPRLPPPPKRKKGEDENDFMERQMAYDREYNIQRGTPEQRAEMAQRYAELEADMARLALEQAPPPPLPRFPTIPREELSLLRRGEAQSVRPEYIEESEYLRRREAGEDVVGQDFEPHPRFYRKRGGASDIGSYRLPPPKAKGFSFFSPYEQDTSTGEFKYGGRSYRELERMGSMSGCAVPTYNPDPYSYWAYRPLLYGALAPLLRGGADRPSPPRPPYEPRSPSAPPPPADTPPADDPDQRRPTWNTPPTSDEEESESDSGESVGDNPELNSVDENLHYFQPEIILYERNDDDEMPRDYVRARNPLTAVQITLQPLKNSDIMIGVYLQNYLVGTFTYQEGETEKQFVARQPQLKGNFKLRDKLYSAVKKLTEDEDLARRRMFGDGRRKQKK
jgi:hypothetical protein